MELRFLRCARTHLRWSGLHGRRRPQGDSVTQSVCPPPTRYPPISACSVCLMSPRGVLHGCFRVTEKTHRSFSNAVGVGLLLPTVAPPQRSNARQASLPERPPCRVWSMRASGCTARRPSRDPRRSNRGVQAGGSSPSQQRGALMHLAALHHAVNRSDDALSTLDGVEGKMAEDDLDLVSVLHARADVLDSSGKPPARRPSSPARETFAVGTPNGRS